MSGSSFGTLFKISTWGESHGKALGVVIDGCPAGIPLCEVDFSEDMKRRAPGQTKYATPRKEADEVEILSGVFEGKTTGTPISLMIKNTSQRSGDYSEVASYYRPGHADYGFDAKFGFRDYRGGGRSSGRETAARVAAGVVAAKLLSELGIKTTAYVKQIGPYACEKNVYSRQVSKEGSSVTTKIEKYIPERDIIEKSPLRMPDPDASQKAEKYLMDCIQENNSSGGLIECVITGVPAGVGDPVFDKLDALLGQAVFSIGAVKGVEIGAGFSVVETKGLDNNDSFLSQSETSSNMDNKNAPDANTAVPDPIKETNNSGGILGGISDGDDIIIRAAFKPTPSISAEQQTVNKDGNPITISVKGRHDPIIVARAVVVVEAMANIVLADRLLVGMSAKLDRIKDFYGK